MTRVYPFVLTLIFAGAAYAAPPPAPNVCSGTLCLEVMPALRSGHPLVRPKIRTVRDGEVSRVDLEFADLGTVSVRDIPTGQPAGSVDVSTIKLCAKKRPCRTVGLFVEGASSPSAGEWLKCRVTRIWTVSVDEFLILRNLVAVPYDEVASLRLSPTGKCERTD